MSFGIRPVLRGFCCLFSGRLSVFPHHRQQEKAVGFMTRKTGKPGAIENKDSPISTQGPGKHTSSVPFLGNG